MILDSFDIDYWNSLSEIEQFQTFIFTIIIIGFVIIMFIYLNKRDKRKENENKY